MRNFSATAMRQNAHARCVYRYMRICQKQIAHLLTANRAVLLLLMLMLTLMPALSYAQSVGAQSFIANFPPWVPLVAAAIMIGYSIGGLAYMLSTVFRTPELTVWAKTEIAEVTASAFLVLILIMALSSSDAIFAAATGTTPMQASLDFTNDASNKLFDVYVNSMWLSTAVGTLTGPPPQYATSKAGQDISSKMADKGPPGTPKTSPGGALRTMIIALYTFNVNYQPFWGVNVFMAHFGTVQSLSLVSALIAVVSNLALKFIQAMAIPLMLPLGLFLSVFSITRKMGRTLIAFGVGLYLFLPASILISKSMYESAYKSDPIPPIAEPTRARELIKALLWVQGAEIAVALFAPPLFLPKMVDPAGGYIKTCTGGALTLASTCGLLYPVCLVIYYLICTIFTRPVFDLPASMDASIALISAVSSTAKAIALSSILKADVPAGYFVAIGAPAIPAFVSVRSGDTWGYVPGQANMPNTIQIVRGIIAALLNPLASFYGFLSHFYLDQALASALTDITLDYIPYVLQYAVPIMLIPVIVLLVTVTAIRSISPAIGGEVQILGLSELI